MWAERSRPQSHAVVVIDRMSLTDRIHIRFGVNESYCQVR